VPGPKLFALTDLIHLYYTAKGEWSAKLKTLHDQYGPTVRFAPNEVSSITPETWRIVYGHKTQQGKTFEKDLRFYGPTYVGVDHIIRANNEGHRRMRRVMAHAFSEKALREQEDVIKGYVDLLISRLNDKAVAQEDVDIMSWYNFCTFDLIGDLTFGKPFGCLESGDYSPWISMIFSNIKLLTTVPALRRHPFLAKFRSWLIEPKLERAFVEHALLSQKTAFERIERGNVGRQDFMDYILRHNGDEAKGLSKDEIAANAPTLITAGSETTATLLSGVTFMLLTNRDKYDKLVREIRDRYASEDEINMLNVNDLPYLLAVLNEAFRMYPPVPIGLPRITPAGGETIDGYYLPEKTGISLPHWAAYQCEQNWTDPQLFVPERWLDTETRYANDKRDVLQPFSIGPRNCIGKNLAYAEMRLILTRVLWRFDLELLPESRGWYSQRVFGLWEKGGMMVKLTPVQRS